MTHRLVRTALALSLLALCVSACKKKGRSSSKSGPVLANVGDEVITADDFKKRLDETSPFLRARYNTPERKKEFLENMIRNELLAQEAQRRGLVRNPTVQEVMKRAMVQELLREQLDERLPGNDITEVELKRYYDEHLDDYMKPGRLRVNTIAVSDRAKAVRLLREISDREELGELNAFQVVAMKESEDKASAPMGGDLRYLSQDEMSKERGDSFARAAFQLIAPGEKAGPIETQRGFEIIKLQNKTPALDKRLDEVKEQVRQRMARERRSKEYEDFIRRLREEGHVRINDEEIAKLPTAEAHHPGQPGGLPPNVQLPPSMRPAQQPPAPDQTATPR